MPHPDCRYVATFWSELREICLERPVREHKKTGHIPHIMFRATKWPFCALFSYVPSKRTPPKLAALLARGQTHNEGPLWPFIYLGLPGELVVVRRISVALPGRLTS